MNKIEVPLKNGMKLVVDVYGAEPECCNDEISISVVDKDGCYMQDIVVVREHLDSSEKHELIQCFVYGDEGCEDYTDKFNIGLYQEGK